MGPQSQTIGIIGGGQLGRMLAMAAAHMGFSVHVYTPEQTSPAAQVSQRVSVGAYDDAAALTAFAKTCDIITFEFENVPYESLMHLKEHAFVAPDPEILRICRHRLREKEAVNQAGINTAPFAPVCSVQELQKAIEQIGCPCVLKSCELGYDGKGQVKITDSAQAEQAWAQLATTQAVLEGWLSYEREISVIVARGRDGAMICYEPSHNIHENHILARSIVPAELPDTLASKAQQMAQAIAQRFELVGIMAVEMFVMPSGELIVNELAPRPHNSGHWTIEAAATSQFEQQIRAIAGMALGDARTLCSAQMVNLIGDDIQNLDAYYADSGAHVHLYGKQEARSGRKMGHVTLLGD